MKRNVFFTSEDRLFFLRLLKEYAVKSELEIVCYCLMTNHTHLLVIPNSMNSLEKALKPLHLRYSQRLNRRSSTVGLNWQGRFFSTPLDSFHTLRAIQYIVLNPVRAGIVSKPEDYRWSSARAHLFGEENEFITTSEDMKSLASRAVREFQNEQDTESRNGAFKIISRNTAMNIPTGSDSFIDDLEQETGRSLRYRPRGRPKKG